MSANAGVAENGDRRIAQRTKCPECEITLVSTKNAERVYPNLNSHEQDALEEARHLGVWFCAHCPRPVPRGEAIA